MSRQVAVQVQSGVRAQGGVRGRSAVRVLAGALAAATLLAGCVGMPTSGPVQAGVEGVVDPGPVQPLGDLPALDADPAEIVQGFLSASAAGFGREDDPTTDFSVARAYLTGESRSTWSPRERVVVYPTSSMPEISLVPDTATRVEVRLTVAARIDADGRYAEAPAGTSESLVFDLVQDSRGQWRISGLDDGVVLSEPNFSLVYRSAAVYFLSADSAFLVPETRWFPLRGIATSVMQALLAGPSEWLRDAVRTAVPEGAALNPVAVNVDAAGTAVVGLSRGSLPEDPQQRALMLAQVEASLRPVRVHRVEVDAEGVPAGVEAAELTRGADTAATLLAVVGDRLVTVNGAQLTEVPEVAPLTGLEATAVASDEAGALRVLLQRADALLTVPTAELPAAPFLTGAGLLAPSVDRFGWVWTASPGGDLLAARTDGTQVPLGGEWLADRDVRSLRVSRDGGRLALVSVVGDDVVVEVAGVVRDAAGVPQALTEPLGVGAALTDARQVVWVDDATLGVLGRSRTATLDGYHLVTIGGQTVARPAMSDTAAIAGGAGTTALYLLTTGGGLYARSGPGWTQIAEGVQAVGFPG